MSARNERFAGGSVHHLVGQFRSSVEWRYPLRLLHGRSATKRLPQLILMQRRPLNHKTAGSRWQLALDECQGIDGYGGPPTRV